MQRKRMFVTMALALLVGVVAAPMVRARLGGGHRYRSAPRRSYGGGSYGSSRSYRTRRSYGGSLFGSSRSSSSRRSSRRGRPMSGAELVIFLIVGAFVGAIKLYTFVGGGVIGGGSAFGPTGMSFGSRKSSFKRGKTTPVPTQGLTEPTTRQNPVYRTGEDPWAVGTASAGRNDFWGGSGPVGSAGMKTGVERLKTVDPNFSEILFIDFARLLYTRFHEARGPKSGSTDILKFFISENLMQNLLRQRLGQGPQRVDEVRDVIIGSASVSSYQVEEQWTTIPVDFCANFTCFGSDTPDGATIYTEQQAVFRRRTATLSPGPQQMRSLHCPSCGSPVSCDVHGACAHCGAVDVPGEKQWQMVSMTSSMTVLSYVHDNQQQPMPRGNQTMTPVVTHPDVDANLRDLMARDQSFSVALFEERVKTVFFALQAGWGSLQWEETRPFQTESLYTSNLFWIEQYRRKGWANRLDNPEVIRVLPVKVTHDAFYDSITALIIARGCDYTIDSSGTILCGDPHRASDFREYWTFIRALPSADAQTAAVTNCPNCGASLDNAAHQDCPYCGGLIKSSTFDWTLAYIEQPDSYRG